MLKLKIPDMSCSHCAASIEKALRGVDSAAQVEIELTNRAVTIRSVADEARLRDAVPHAHRAFREQFRFRGARTQ